MKARISAKETIVFKFFMAPFFVLAPILFFVFTTGLTRNAIFAYLIILIITGPVWWTLFQLKTVYVVNDYLVISNLKDTIRVHIALVEELNEGFFCMKLIFKKETPFGKKIVFRLPYRWRIYNPEATLEDPVITELKNKIENL